jgi:hypothetical protein
LVQAVETVAGECRLHCDAMVVRLLGKLAAPEHPSPRCFRSAYRIGRASATSPVRRERRLPSVRTISTVSPARSTDCLGRLPMNVLRYFLITLTLAALAAIGYGFYMNGLPSGRWWDVSPLMMVVGALVGALILNSIYLALNRPTRGRVSAQPATASTSPLPEPTRAVNVKALAYLGAACVIAWLAVDIAIKLEQRQVLDRQEKLLADLANGVHDIARSVPGTSEIESSLKEIESSVSDMKNSTCEIAAGRDTASRMLCR